MISTTNILDTISQDATQPVDMDMLTTMHTSPLTEAISIAIAQLVQISTMADQLTISTEVVMSTPTQMDTDASMFMPGTLSTPLLMT